MDVFKCEFRELLSLLGRAIEDPVVGEFIECTAAAIRRSAHVGVVEFKPHGLEVIFVEAPWAVSPAGIEDRRKLYIEAFHLHREGHNGHSGYPGHLPSGVALNDRETEVIRKLGVPAEVGGGGIGTVLKRPIPRWLRYPIERAVLQFQVDQGGRVEMATLMTAAAVPRSSSP